LEEASHMVEMKVASVGVVQGTNGTVVVLRETEGPRLLVIGIGPLEASAIALEMEGITPPRPQTHDLIRNIIEAFGATVTRVAITDLRDETFYARIVVRTESLDHDIDSRPSDGIALALRAGAPVYCAEAVLESAGIIPADDDADVVH